jgi:hypothetical protein
MLTFGDLKRVEKGDWSGEGQGFWWGFVYMQGPFGGMV